MNYQKLVRSRLNRVEPAPLILLAVLAVGLAVLLVKNILEGAYSGAVVLAVMIALLAVLFVQKLPGQKYRRYCEKLAKLGDPDQLFAHLETLQPCEAAAGTDLRFDERYLAWIGEKDAAVCDAKELVWGYLYDEVRQKHFAIIPLGSEHTYAAMLCFSNGSSFPLQLQDRETVLAVLEQLKAAYPYMMMGYNAQLEAIFRKDPRQLWSAAGYQNRQDETV